MATAYRPLFTIRLRHSYYTTGQATGDLALLPSPSTGETLDDYGFIFRTLSDGCAVYAEVMPESATPDGSPAEPFRPIADETLRFQFYLRARNPHLLNMSALANHRPGRSTFYFSNLRNDEEDGLLHLGDSVSDSRVGAPIALTAGQIHTYRFAAPVARASLELTDTFGNELYRTSLTVPEPGEPTSEYRLPLDAVEGLRAGRYRLSDDSGGSQDFYWDPQIFGMRPFGVIEIFSSTRTLTADGSDQVPDAYRFLSGGRIGGREYHLQLESRATTWRYNVIKKYEGSELELEDVDISGPIAFDKALQGDRAVFTSKDEVELRQRQRALTLVEKDTSPSTELRSLPNPRPNTVLQKGRDSGHFVSEMYVYV